MSTVTSLFTGRVLHITRDFPPRSTGGISTAVGSMVRASRAAGVDCAVVSFDAWRPRAHKAGPARTVARLENLVEGDPTTAVTVLRLTTPAQLADAGMFVTQFQPHVLHVHHSTLWPFAAEARERLSIPALLTVHVLQAEQDRLRGIYQPTHSSVTQATALAQADSIHAPSRTVADILARALSDRRSRIHTIPLAIHDTPIAQHAATRRTPEGDGPVIYAGRFADINGTSELFAAIPEILYRVPSAHFVIAGGIPENLQSEKRWRKRWETFAPDNVRKHVRFAGWLDQADLHRLYSQARILVSVGWFETFGLTVLEAMLFGLAISATSAGGVAELITHEHTGLLAAPRDTNSFIGNTVALLRQPERALELGAAAARKARAEYLWSRVLSRLTTVYRALRPDQA